MVLFFTNASFQQNQNLPDSCNRFFLSECGKNQVSIAEKYVKDPIGLWQEIVYSVGMPKDRSKAPA
jgi:hypothetical protein